MSKTWKIWQNMFYYRIYPIIFSGPVDNPVFSPFSFFYFSFPFSFSFSFYFHLQCSLHFHLPCSLHFHLPCSLHFHLPCSLHLHSSLGKSVVGISGGSPCLDLQSLCIIIMCWPRLTFSVYEEPVRVRLSRLITDRMITPCRGNQDRDGHQHHCRQHGWRQEAWSHAVVWVVLQLHKSFVLQNNCRNRCLFISFAVSLI